MIVLDSNIYISGLIFPKSPPGKILNLARDRKIDLICSSFILKEIKRALVVKFNYSEELAQKFIDEILKFTKVIQPHSHVSVIKEKADDNRILECAVSAKAQFLVSGDMKHILPLARFKGVIILSAADFLRKISRRLE